jgi:hypothetical protein
MFLETSSKKSFASNSFVCLVIYSKVLLITSTFSKKPFFSSSFFLSSFSFIICSFLIVFILSKEDSKYLFLFYNKSFIFFKRIFNRYSFIFRFDFVSS